MDMQDKLIKYVNPYGPLPRIAGTKRGSLLVIGSACCVWEDLRHYDHQHGAQDRMGINDLTMFYSGRLDHGATLHAEKWPMWGFMQKTLQTHSHVPHEDVIHVWLLTRDGGTSGIFGAIIGLLMGYNKIILAGIPGDDSPRFFDPPWINHPLCGREDVFVEWVRLREEVPMAAQRIRSLSGKTQALFGAPE